RAVQFPAADGFDRVLEPRLLRQELLDLGVGHGLGESPAHFLEASQEIARHRHALFDVTENGLGGVEPRLLREVPHPDGVGRARPPEEVRIGAGHDSEERGLAGAVRPEHADLRAREKRQVDAAENLALGRDDLPEVTHGEDVLRRHRVPYDTRRAGAEDDRRREEEPVADRRVQFDFEIEFSNGGGLMGREFRLDIGGDDISDEALADYVVRDLRLLMVRRVRVRNKTILKEAHKRPPAPPGRLVDVSHDVEDGMVTYRGLPAPAIRDHWTREESRRHFASGTEFHIGRIDMVANTGTYVDSPFHRYADGPDLAGLPLESLADLPGVVVRATERTERGIDPATLSGLDVRGKALLLHTGWDIHWRTDRYFEGHPFLARSGAEWLADHGAAMVGIDSLNIDDTT